jgi:DNA gyrase subunit A
MADELKSKRHHTGHAVLPHERVPWRQDHRHKELMFFAGVGLSVLVILGLYAASFRYQPAFQDLFKQSTAWQSTKDNFLKQTNALQKSLTQLNQVKADISAVLNARTTQARSLELLKAKIESASTTKSATSTAMAPEEKNQNPIGNIETRAITDEVQESYLDYAMSVIVARALPDVRDGLKPVHRRILYSMWQSGLRAGAKFKKSATVVGDVLGKYHPHGDSAVYDSMVRMAQDFSLRYPLVKGQGNFGSMDGDSAAAYRYTEAKLALIAEEMLYDIDRDTVNFVPNYDGAHKEPSVLPAKLPNLLINGTLGIAVGMATNIPPHNLGEVCDAITHLIANPDCSVDDLTEFVKGPDFPTGGIIYDTKAIRQTYATGRGGIVMRARAEIVELKSGQFNIVVTEVPYQVNKATVLEKIAELVHDKKLEGIRDLRDESNKDGVRVVIELKKDAYPKKILNKLFSVTQFQETFHVNMLALDGGIQPRIMNLKAILEAYLKHRQEVVRRRTAFDLARAEERAHILRGLKIALDNLDAVIKTIKASKDKEEAKVNLMKKFKLDDIQAQAILDMRLQQLANLEQQKIIDELKEKLELIKTLEAILSSPKKILGIIKDEVSGIKEKFASERRTQIVAHGVKEFSAEDFVPNEPTIVMMTADGYIKRLPPDTFRTQERGGKGVMGMTTAKEEDIVENLFTTMTHANLLFFTTRGRVFQLKAYDVPAASRTSKGQAVVNFLQLAPNEKVSAVLSVSDLETKYLVMVTRNGVIKKVEMGEFADVRRSGLIAIKLKNDDGLEWVKPSSGTDDIMIATAGGQSVRFNEKGVRPMGRTAAGVRGMKLKGKDVVVGMDVVDTRDVNKGLFDLMVITEHGYGKRTNLKNYKTQGRGGSGIKTAEVTAKTGPLVTAMVVSDKDERDVITISVKGQVIRFNISTIPQLNRQTQGVRIMRFKEDGDSVSSATLI